MNPLLTHDAAWALVTEHTASESLRKHMLAVEAAEPEGRAQALAGALTTDGYAATARSAPVGEQLCQHHCPVAHVAEQFPALCEAETEVFARLLGTHVQRLATIAHGDGVCTTYIPEIKLRSAGRTSS